MTKSPLVYKIRAIKTFGSSMMPLLRDGDVVFIKKIKFQKIKVNDIICIAKNGKIFTHRVIYKTKGYVITKGDNNNISDGKVYSRNILGTVYQIKRNGEVFSIETLYLMQSTLYFQEIITLKSKLEKERIDFIFLKGLPLHLYFEKHHPKRIYADCDILIKGEDLHKVSSILNSLGYGLLDTSISKWQKKLKGKDIELSFYKTINNFTVFFDIHLEVVFMMTQIGKLKEVYPQKLINSITWEFLRDKRNIEVNNEIFPILSTSNLFIYLTLHLYHHNFTGAYRFDFLAELIRKEPIDFREVSKILSKYRLENFVYPCFFLLNKYYNVKFPTSFLKSIEPKGIAMRFIRKNILSESIFDEKDRIGSGVKRFRNLFILSPNNIFEKIQIVLNPQILYAISWVIIRKFRIFIQVRSIRD